MLELDFLCEKYQCLPQAGGIYDQDQMVMRKLLIVSSAKSERQERKKK